MSFRGIRHWKNFWGNQASDASYHVPRDASELPDDVHNAGRIEKRPVGGSFAWSPLVPVGAGAGLIDASCLNRVLHVDPLNCTVHVEAGTTIRELARATSEQGLS